jgi:amino acid adenylation domain-containing protein
VPVQVIGVPPTPLPLVDLSGLPVARREAEAAACILRDTRAPFDLAADPPLRARLLRLDAADHALSLTLHHIASDGWSNGLLVREIAELYRAYAAGRPAVLPNLPVQYADFAAWQRRAFASGALDVQRDWWRQRLSSPPPPLDLPTDRPRPAVPTWAGASRSLGLPPELAGRVDALGRRRGTTLFMTLLAAFATVLSRVSGQDDLTVGTPIAGRSRTEIEGLVGFFVNTLVLRVDLTGDPSFTDLLGRVRDTAIGAFVHQDIPFEKLVEELQPERDLTHPPLFQVLFALQNAPAPDLEVSGLGFHRIEAGSGAATFDLTLSCAGDPGGIGTLLQYRTDLFDAPSMDRLLGHFRTLLTAAAADPERRLGDLPLLTGPERHQLVIEHNDTAARLPGGLCLHELFARQVERTPEAVALVVAATGEELTWRDLDVRASRLAAWLQARGVGPEVTVGICLEPSPELIVALQAVPRAGGAWVPLDPAYPPERLAFLVEDAGVSVLLDRKSWPVDLPDIRPRPSGVTPDHLAYSIYTSGSTGRPKAVQVPHRAIVHYLLWFQEDFPLGPSDVVLHTFSVSFDASFFDLWAPLLAGARLILPSPATARDAARAAEEIARFGVTRMLGVPPWIAELVERPELDEATVVREVFLGGQELSADLARRLLARGWRAMNFYGPSEAVVAATGWPAAPEPADRTVPIGRPLSDVQAHILGPAAEPLPLGVPGELCLGGAGVVRGYKGRPDLTAGRFRPDPFGGPGARLYHTGDRARRRPDGVLEFLGRVDRQVKIRGFRIEPGEVEAVLAAHPALRDAAVAARATRGGEVRLIAWAVPREPVTVAELRAWLRERLPAPLIPAAWVLLDVLPLTPNDKVDLAALPEPEAISTSGERVAPRDDLERDLAALWEELLDVHAVGVQDDFFALGGHSLLVLRLLSRIEKQLGTKLPPAVLFAAPTIEKLAAILRDGRGPEAGPLVVLAPGGDRPPLVWAHTAAGTVTAYADFARRLHAIAPDRPVWALQAPADLPATLEELAAGHVTALRAAQPEGPYHLAGWSFGGVVAFEIARQLREAGAEVAKLALVDSRAPGTQNIPEDLPGLLGAFAADQNLPPDVDPQDIETLRPLFETFQRLLGMLRIYHPRPYPGPIRLFRAEERADDLGWSRLAEGGLDIHPLPGDHYTLLHGEALVQALRD